MTNVLPAVPDTTIADQKALEMFRQQWQLYRKIIDHDYLGNDGAYVALRRFLEQEVARPYHFLDLACGDASGITKALTGTAIESYRGVDLSAPALELAKANLAVLPCPVSLEEQDFTYAVRSRLSPSTSFGSACRCTTWRRRPSVRSCARSFRLLARTEHF